MQGLVREFSFRQGVQTLLDANISSSLAAHPVILEPGTSDADTNVCTPGIDRASDASISLMLA